MESKTNIVLVHGAWADGSCWSKVIPLLQQEGFNATAAQIPLTSLADDIAVTRNPELSFPARPMKLRTSRLLFTSQRSVWMKARASML